MSIQKKEPQNIWLGKFLRCITNIINNDHLYKFNSYHFCISQTYFNVSTLLEMLHWVQYSISCYMCIYFMLTKFSSTFITKPWVSSIQSLVLSPDPSLSQDYPSNPAGPTRVFNLPYFLIRATGTQSLKQHSTIYLPFFK